MKKLTKEQLEDLVNDTMIKVSKINAENISKKVSECVKNADNLGGMIGEVIIIYGIEIKKECSRVIADVLYDIFYAE